MRISRILERIVLLAPFLVVVIIAPMTLSAVDAMTHHHKRALIIKSSTTKGALHGFTPSPATDLQGGVSCPFRDTCLFRAAENPLYQPSFFSQSSLTCSHITPHLWQTSSLELIGPTLQNQASYMVPQLGHLTLDQ